jgi:hypothetical protein
VGPLLEGSVHALVGSVVVVVDERLHARSGGCSHESLHLALAIWSDRSGINGEVSCGFVEDT